MKIKKNNLFWKAIIKNYCPRVTRIFYNDRKELFIVTKVNFKSYENTRETVLNSLKNLQVDYLDMVLLHWPYGNTYHAYRELEKMYEEGLIRSIGISNYQESQYVDLIHFNKVVPVVNQIKITLR